MGKPESGDVLNIEVVYSPSPRQVSVWNVELPPGATLQKALLASVYLDFPELRSARPVTGVWGKRTGFNHVLRPMDRVEIYRALRVDPKVARRERFQRQGAKTAGLFAKTRAGAKAGY
jgi:putative ubiquitin-RnfH superfamily antitoxin RatB of RatAB toxin-antitoxin module